MAIASRPLSPPPIPFPHLLRYHFSSHRYLCCRSTDLSFIRIKINWPWLTHERPQDVIRVAKVILFSLFASGVLMKLVATQFSFAISSIDSRITIFRIHFPTRATICVIVLCYITFCNFPLISIALEFLPMANGRENQVKKNMKYELRLWNVHLTVCERSDNHRGDEV